MLLLGETVILLPIPAGVPPHEPENHSAVAPVPALPPIKVKVVLSPLQMVEIPVMLVGAIDGVLRIIIISLDSTVKGDTQAAVEVIRTLILSLAAKLLLTKVAPVSPFNIPPFLYH